MAIERIQLRRGTAQQWTDTDPILGAAEIGVELGTPNQFKIGDGSSLWSELDYFSPSGGLDFIPTSEKGTANGVATLDVNGAIPTGQLANLINSAPEALDTLSELAAALADDADFATTITQSLATKADTSHTHTKSDITDFSHTHTKADITDFSHTHTEGDITDLGNYIELLDLSVTNLTASGSGSLAYDNTTGEFSYTPAEIPDVSGQISSAIASATIDADQVATAVASSSSTSYTLQAADKNSIILFTSTSAISFSVADVLSVGDTVTIIQDNTGQVTISGTGVYGAGTDGGILKTRTRYSSATILKVATGQYRVFGDLAIA